MEKRAKYSLQEYSESVENLPYTDTLLQVRKFVMGQRSSGEGYCHPIAKLNSNVIPDLEQMAGEYIAPDGSRLDHGFNYDKKRNIYVDATADQFGEEAITIYPLPCKTLEVSSLKTFFERYLEFGNLFTGRDLGLHIAFLRNAQLLKKSKQTL